MIRDTNFQTINSASFQTLITERMKGFQLRSTETLDKMLDRKKQRKKRKDNRQFRMTMKSYFPEKMTTQSSSKNASVLR